MRLSIIKAKKIQNIMLPEMISGSYWISDTNANGIKKNLISIEADNGQWKLVSNKEVYIFSNTIQSYAYLEFGKFYNIKNDNENSSFLIYCSPIETKYSFYDITNNLDLGISIGNNSDSIICFDFLENTSFYIRRENNKIFVLDNQSKYGIYVNNVRVNKKIQIKVGDVVFLNGVKFVLIIDNNSYILGISDNTLTTKLQKKEKLNVNNSEYEELEDEVEFPLYQEEDYFHKVPRFVELVKPLELKVDAPPAKQDEQGRSLLLTIGPMITMSMTSLVTGYTALNSVLNGGSTWDRAMPSLVICGAMFASVLIWPLISRMFEKKTREKNEKLRQNKYGEYIEEKRQTIIKAKNEQQTSLNNNYPLFKDTVDIIKGKYTTLWQRRIEDEDYMDVTLGEGSIPMQINIKYPEQHFSMVEDNLKDMVLKLEKEPKMLNNVPIVFSFLKNYISAIIGNDQIVTEYTKRLIIQLLALHSYDDLKIIILTDEEREYQWKFLKGIPHCFTNDQSLRFFAVNNDEYKEVCYYLDKEFERIKEQAKNSEMNLFDLNTTYLIITDSYKKIKDFDIVNKILDSKKNYGFSICILDDKITNLPDQCATFIQVNDVRGEYHNTYNYNEKITFSIDMVTKVDYEEITKKLANIPVEFKNSANGQLPDKIGFLEMYDVGKIEQLNSPVRWSNSNPMLNLQVPVGIGKNGEKISIDLHEKYHGPHGLIAGMTGSGKSEFIITYILSMAVNYHPYEVQFIIIDYKGGGLANAFENANIGLKLPHLVGTITNLDANEIKRSLASIESEIKRRQALFNKARELSDESTIDIYKYQRMYRDKIIDEPLSHLFIVCDEFAELKTQQPDFMEQLISASRIGRSLGIHLILATQKPSGVVDPQIWSNTRFRVCMRVQDKSDSNDVIKCPNAAYLKHTGRFYFQVGYNEIFVLGQSAYAGGKYIPAETVNKTIDSSINFINNVGYSIKNVETKEKKEIITTVKGEELINIVKYLSDLAITMNINCRPLWLEKIPEFITVNNLVSKYNYIKENFVINPIVGEYDIPNKQKQKLLTLPLSKDGNAIIYGTSGSGKENFITTLIYSSLLYYSPSEVNYYIIDFGSGALRMFEKCPIVGDVLNDTDEDKIENLYKMLSSIIEERKQLFFSYNGDYHNYCSNSGNTVPNIIVIINNYESYQETYGNFDEILTALSRECNKYGIYFIITVNTPNGVRFKLKQNFSLIYVLQQNNEDDYSTILGNIHKNYPTKSFGRGIIKKEDFYEFQTAFVTEKENITTFIKEKCNEIGSKYQIKAKKVPVLPNIVGYNDISKELGKNDKLIIGIDKETLEISTFDFNKNYITIVTGVDLSIMSNFINPLINQIIILNSSNLIVINTEDFYINEEYKNNYNYINNQYNDIFNWLMKFLKDKNDAYINNNYQKSIFENEKKINCIIIGIETFKNRLSDENKTKFGDLFNLGRDLGIINFIIIDTIDKIKKIELESWYKNCVNNNSGIWIGNGINDQFSLKVSQKINEMKEEVPNGFCFVIERGKIKFVKYVEILELKIN